MLVSIERVREDFFAGARSSALPFVSNDAVEIVAGQCAGVGGAVISVEGVEPLVYLVERGDGAGDVLVEAANLRLAVEN
jgi:hypothetical protein